MLENTDISMRITSTLITHHVHIEVRELTRDRLQQKAEMRAASFSRPSLPGYCPHLSNSMPPSLLCRFSVIKISPSLS